MTNKEQIDLRTQLTTTGKGRLTAPSSPLQRSCRWRPNSWPAVVVSSFRCCCCWWSSSWLRPAWLTRRNTFWSFMLLFTFLSFFFCEPAAASGKLLDTWPTRLQISDWLYRIVTNMASSVIHTATGGHLYIYLQYIHISLLFLSPLSISFFQYIWLIVCCYTKQQKIKFVKPTHNLIKN